MIAIFRTMRWYYVAFIVFFLTMAPSQLSAEEPKQELKQKPLVLINISKETTFITEPLRPDGYPDYLAALNLRFSKDVTPENNSAVLFWKAVGPSIISPELRPKYFQMLGMHVLPEKGDYLVDLDTYVERLNDADILAGYETLEERQEEAVRQMSIARRHSWKKEEFPLLAGWIATNEKPLALLIEASKRSRRYDPLICDSTDDDLCYGVLLHGPQVLRDVTRALTIRAMYRAGNKDFKDAWEDIMTCHRYARLAGQGLTLVEVIVAAEADNYAFLATQGLLKSTAIPSDDLENMRSDLLKLGAMPNIADKIDFCERIITLDIISRTAREGYYSLLNASGYIISDDRTKQDISRDEFEIIVSHVRHVLNLVFRLAIDWNRVHRIGNNTYDRASALRRLPTRAARMRAFDRFESDLKETFKRRKNWRVIIFLSLLNPRRIWSERFGELTVSSFMPAIKSSLDLQDRVSMEVQLTDLAFAMAEYRAEHGGYPSGLRSLNPKYISKLPKDIFNHDADLKYCRSDNGYMIWSVGPNGKDDKGMNWYDRASREDGDDVNGDDIRVRITAEESRK